MVHQMFTDSTQSGIAGCLSGLAARLDGETILHRLNYSRFQVNLFMQAVYLVLLKGLVAFLFTLLLSTLLIMTIVVEGAAGRGASATAQFAGHNVGYAIAFAW